jgi:hypothetical protein
MKFLIFSFLSALLIGCSSTTSKETTTESNSQDSALSANVNAIDEETYEPEEEIVFSDSLAEAIQSEIGALEEEIKSGTYYTLYAQYSGYESSAEATYYFDSLFNIIYCDGTWGVEGTSGVFTYFFVGDDLLAGTETNTNQVYEEKVWIHKKFKPTYGFSTTDEEGSENEITYLTDENYKSINSKARSDYEKLLNTIQEYSDSVSLSDDEASILVETVVNYGEDYTERETYTISRALFDTLIKE